jgi:hypothetical protein
LRRSIVGKAFLRMWNVGVLKRERQREGDRERERENRFIQK